MKIIDEYWSDDYKQYCLTIATNFGEFTGIATCSPEDIENGLATKWDGMDIAFYRAVMQYTKAKANAYRQRYLGMKEVCDAACDHFYDSFKLDVDDIFDKNDEEYQKIVQFTQGEGSMYDFFKYQRERLYRRYKEERQKYLDLRDNFNSYVEKLQKDRQEMRKKLARSAKSNS